MCLKIMMCVSLILRTPFDVNLDVLEKKPWRDPGTDTSDFFNFGLNEQSWKDYCKPLVSRHVFVPFFVSLCQWRSWFDLNELLTYSTEGKSN